MFIIEIALAVAFALAPTPIDHIHDVFGDLGDEVVMEAITVAWCESRLEADAHRSSRSAARRNPTVVRSGDYGLFQINYLSWGNRSNGWSAPEGVWLFDARANAEFARRLYDDTGGWHNWVCKPHPDGNWRGRVHGKTYHVPEEYRLLPEPTPEPPVVVRQSEIFTIPFDLSVTLESLEAV